MWRDPQRDKFFCVVEHVADQEPGKTQAGAYPTFYMERST